MRAAALALSVVGAGMVLASSGSASASSGGAAFTQFFTTSCAERSDYEAAKAAALAAGWVSVVKDAEDADLQNMLKQTRALQQRVKVLGSIMTFEAYAMQTDGHRYSLVIASTRGRPGQPGSLDCNLYDFTESAPIDPALVEEALDVTAREHQEDRGASLDVWSLKGAPHVTLGFIPPQSEVAGLTGYAGAWLTITTYAVMP